MKRLTDDKRFLWQYLASTVVLIAGVVLIFFSFFAPPKGVIDASVLTAFGEALSFVGAVWGIATSSSRKTYEIERKYGAMDREEDK